MRSIRLGTAARPIAMAAAAIVVACASSAALAQQLSKQLLGYWQLVSIENEVDGKRSVGSFGPNPKGMFIFDPSGRYSIQIFSPDLPKFASKDRMNGTAEENKAVVQGTLSHFGTYKVDDAGGTLTVLPEASSFPNWTGTEQPPRKITIAGDQLTLVNPAPTTGRGASYLVWKRLK